MGCRQHTPVHMNPVCAHIVGANVLENKRREERAEGGAESPSGRGALATRGGGWSPDSPLLTRDPVSETNESLLKPWQQLFKLKLQPFLQGRAALTSAFWGGSRQGCLQAVCTRGIAPGGLRALLHPPESTGRLVQRHQPPQAKAKLSSLGFF